MVPKRIYVAGDLNIELGLLCACRASSSETLMALTASRGSRRIVAASKNDVVGCYDGI